jgi:uncharacterized RDD family membrane protein YckC
LIQLLELQFGTTCSHIIFRLAVIDQEGKRAGLSRLSLRWTISWLPLLIPMSFTAVLIQRSEYSSAFVTALILLIFWFGAAFLIFLSPNRGLHDRWSGTWVVRR